MRDLLDDDQAVVEDAAAVGRRPALGVVLRTEVVLVRLEGFHGDVEVEILVVANSIEVVEADIDRKIGAPVVLMARIGDGTSRIDIDDPVGSASHREVETGFLEIPALVPVARQNRKLTQNQRQFDVSPVRRT